MKAAIYTKYGPPEVFKITEVKKPLPKDNEVLIKIHAATVTSGDVRLRSSDFPALFWLPARLIFGLFKPKKSILGHELSGVVEDKGKNATKFEVGDHVFGTTTMLSGGSYAEYICLPQEWKHGVVTHKPKNLNFQEAAALPIGAMTAMFLLEKANLSKNQKVLIYGASGSVGSYAVQLAKYHGATVTGVCSGSNFEMVKSLGADHLIDYKKTDYSNLEDKLDIIFDAVGKTSKSHAKKVLKKDGKFISVKMLTKEKPEHLKKIKELAETGELKPFIDKVYSIYDIVDTHTYVDQGHKRGNVVIDLLS
ncbi:NAD(P)-dependent alcohol dehydrogenase [Zobellia roscoffensis]|uniref:NAD(P)-dependent alcohol dehydrogenase n=1 Tax=Zobellia roscoffensis TaxID=2779508 RepID=UPI00188D827D|nr:NAD(P)-dependent alcohol dehydrogenase [Zobellia roscoffensis]